MKLWAKSLFHASCFASLCFVTTLAPAQISSFQHPRVFTTISAPVDATYFLNDPTPPSDPDDD